MGEIFYLSTALFFFFYISTLYLKIVSRPAKKFNRNFALPSATMIASVPIVIHPEKVQ